MFWWNEIWKKHAKINRTDGRWRSDSFLLDPDPTSAFEKYGSDLQQFFPLKIFPLSLYDVRY